MSYGGKPIRINIDSLDGSTAGRIRGGLKDYSSAVFTPSGELYVGRSESGNGWALRYANTGVLFRDDINVDDPAEFKKVLKEYDRYRYLRDLKFTEQGLSARVELVFLDAKKKPDLAKLRARTKFGRLELQEGDTVYLKVVNAGTKKLYVNIVDMQPDGIINKVLPNRDLKDIKNLPRPILPENCSVNVRDSTLNTDMMIVIGKPFGEEIFKVFLSTQLLDLEDMLAGHGDAGNRNSRGVLNNLAKVFDAAENKTGSRGVNPKVEAQDGTIFNLNFTIVPRQE
jgi:hypothetical protein